jgi:hypothetical protein
MSAHELRDSEEAGLFLRQGLWLQRAAAPRAATVKPVLEWALEVAAAGEPLPPVGVVADVGHAAVDAGSDPPGRQELPAVPGWSAGTARTYEDYVLGKLYADGSFERAAGALHRYQGRDRARGLAFVVSRLRQRAGFGGVHLSPAVIKALLERPAEETLARGWESLSRQGLLPLLPGLYEELSPAVRNLAEMLGPEDVFELEHGTALAPFSQRVALRQVLQAAAFLEAGLPRHPSRAAGRRREVPTRVFDEDTYPVGGYSSVATHGSIESLLHSQLACMEPSERPDLFDIKYVRDELLYYARDENQLLRRRRTFVFALYPDLVQARLKDADLPWQRIVLLLALLLVLVRKLSAWLSTDALVFEFLFLQTDETTPLEAEQALLEMLLREQIANGTVRLAPLPVGQLASWCVGRARRSLCHCLTVAATDRPLEAEATVVTRLRLDGPVPAIGVDDEAPQCPEADSPSAGWAAALESVLTGSSQ